MTTATRLLVFLPLLAGAACFDYNPQSVAERRFERTFQVASGGVLVVDLACGSVTTTTGPDGEVGVAVFQQARSTHGERGANELLSSIDVDVTQQGNEVRILQRRTPLNRSGRWNDHVEVRAVVTVPASVRLDMNTRGGRMSIQGDRTAEVRAKTSGGAISADGGSAPMLLGTSGGNIKVARALGVLEADTSGGSVSVGYIGPAASRIDLGTSGGNIRVGIDPAAPLTVRADTRGGQVRIEDLEFEGYTERRSHASGTMNGGNGGILRASTSGGNIVVTAATDPTLAADSRDRTAERVDRASILKRNDR